MVTSVPVAGGSFSANALMGSIVSIITSVRVAASSLFLVFMFGFLPLLASLYGMILS